MNIKPRPPKRLLPNVAILRDLREQIESDPLPAAVIWVEMFLRPKWMRVIEYLFWKMCNFVNSNRAKEMTVGLAQMKVRLWQEFLKKEFDKDLSIANWENPAMNYYAVKWYLSHKKAYSLLDVCLAYTGDINEYYIMLLHDALTHLKA